MSNFIEDYLINPAAAIASAVEASADLAWAEDIDDDIIYSQIASPEFRMYQAII